MHVLNMFHYRGHQFNFFYIRSTQDYCVLRSNYFINRITNDWNSLPSYVIDSSTINTFKTLLDSYLIGLRFTLFYIMHGMYDTNINTKS